MEHPFYDGVNILETARSEGFLVDDADKDSVARFLGQVMVEAYEHDMLLREAVIFYGPRFFQKNNTAIADEKPQGLRT